MSQPSALMRPDSRVSLALSDATYHSFQDVDLPEPQVSSRPRLDPTAACQSPVCYSPKLHNSPVAPDMRRQDSGYESMGASEPSTSRRRTSGTSVSSSTRKRRPASGASRSSATPSGPVAHLPRSGRHSTSSRRVHPRQSPPQQQPVTYFEFPHFTSSEPALEGTAMVPLGKSKHSPRDFDPEASPRSETWSPTCQNYPTPPQTTHYWTSDRTRRLEYAAIDAASKGVRGWVMRHVVPDCFVPKSKRRVGFEDDRGSVIRYRLELEADDGVEKTDSSSGRRRWNGLWFGIRRHSR